jgi:peroxiredoxin
VRTERRTRFPRANTRIGGGQPLPAGTPAPRFALRCAPHCLASSEDYAGRPLVLAFYVADWHPVCRDQLALYQALLPELERLGAALVGVSTDGVWSHAAFGRHLGLDYPLLADDAPRGAVARAYGAYDRRARSARRALAVVDGRGTVRWSAAFPEAINPGADGLFTALEALKGEADAQFV